MQVEVGKIYDGKITGITNFGAFVDIDKETTGLVHISEVALEYVKDIKEHLKVGQDVKVKVVSVDEKGKIGLSIKQALKEIEASKPKRPAEFSWDTQVEDISFEEKLNKFKQASEEKMHDLKRSMEPKRGSNRKNY
ncbi:MAG: S1 RNA-binding domain-containing protein [Ruminococcaceae bacterium]|nr:S1 RNA-binding domain-containing protein [Oscillospiraceae bacterium]